MARLEDYRTDPPLLREDLQRQNQAIGNAFVEFDRRKLNRWQWRGATTDTTVYFSEAVRCRGTFKLRLTPGTVQDRGDRILVALESGTLTVRGVNGPINGDDIDILSTVGTYLYEWDGVAWWRAPVVASGSGLPPVTSNGDVLTVVGGVPAWAPPPPAYTPGLAQYLDTTDSPAVLWNFDETLNAAVGGSSYNLVLGTGGTGSPAPIYHDLLPGLRGFASSGGNGVRLETATGAAVAQHTGAITIEALVQIQGTDGSSRKFVQGATPSSPGPNTNTAWSIETSVSLSNKRWVAGQTFASGSVSKQVGSTYYAGVRYVAFTRDSPGTTWKFWENGILRYTVNTGYTTPGSATDPTHKITFGQAEAGVLGPMCDLAVASCRITLSEKNATQIKAAYNQSLAPVFGFLP